jgi:hypothetical protein
VVRLERYGTSMGDSARPEKSAWRPLLACRRDILRGPPQAAASSLPPGEPQELHLGAGVSSIVAYAPPGRLGCDESHEGGAEWTEKRLVQRHAEIESLSSR